MRSLLLKLFSIATAVSASSISCVGNEFENLLARVACEEIGLVSRCLQEKVPAFELEQLLPCFTANGCEIKDAVWVMQECIMPHPRQELKKRATSGTTTKASSTVTVTEGSTKAGSTTAPSSTAASTTQASSTATSTSAASSTGNSASSTTSGSTTSGGTTSDITTSTSTSGTSTSSTSSTNTNTCYTTSYSSYSACVTASSSTSCYATSSPTTKCASGLLCFATLGANVCMKRDVPLTTSGIVVAVIFGVGASATVFGLIIICLRSRTKANREEMAATAALLNKTNTKDEISMTDKAANRNAVNLPLMEMKGPCSPSVRSPSPRVPLSPRLPLSPRDQSPLSNQEYFDRGQLFRSGSISPIPTIPLVHHDSRALSPGAQSHWSDEYTARR